MAVALEIREGEEVSHKLTATQRDIADNLIGQIIEDPEKFAYEIVALRSELSFQDLRRTNTARGMQWDKRPASLDDLSFRAMELGGESGEAAEAVLLMLAAAGKSQNVAKKLVREQTGRVGGMSLEEAKILMAEELADVVICTDRVAEVLEIDLGQAVAAKFNKTSRKYGFVELPE
jgi:NTP pyrophosphatase (non-canonical NTP hydrolase)